jgi:hypothetical protein
MGFNAHNNDLEDTLDTRTPKSLMSGSLIMPAAGMQTKVQSVIMFSQEYAWRTSWIL